MKVSSPCYYYTISSFSRCVIGFGNILVISWRSVTFYSKLTVVSRSINCFTTFLHSVKYFTSFTTVHILGRMAEKVIPVVKAEEPEEEDLVDPQTELREICSQKPVAQGLWSKYQECNDRVNSRTKTTETCEEELIDYLDVVEKCVSKDLFNRLK